MLQTSFLYSIVPSLLMLGVILIIVMVRFSSLVIAWAKRTIRLPEGWNGEFDRKEVTILLLPSATLTYANFQLAYVITQITALAINNMIWAATILGSFLGIFSLIVVVWNLFRPSRFTALGAVALVLCVLHDTCVQGVSDGFWLTRNSRSQNGSVCMTAMTGAMKIFDDFF